MKICSTSRMQQPSYDSYSMVSARFELPMDLMFDILLRLPIKTLIRFKSVCKTWQTLIKNPNFIEKHQTKLKHSPDYNPILSSVFVMGFDLETKHYNMWLQFRDKTHTPNPNPNFLFESNPCIVAISNGLVCATFGDSEPIICNPTTGGVRKTSQFSLPKANSQSVFFGFGFKDNEHKLFRIVHSTTQSEDFVGAEVYSMRTDIWTEIVKTRKNNTSQCTDCCWFFDLTPVCIKEVFYWKARSGAFKYVVSFDMNGYVFGMIDFPISLKLIMARTPHWKLIDMKGELALTFCRDTIWFELWVLNEKERSWTMKLKVDDLPSIGKSLKVLGCERNGNLVMQHNTPDFEKKLFSYDVESHNIVYLPFPALKQSYNVYLYTESLLLV